MGNFTDTVFTEQQSLVTEDAAGLLAGILPHSTWQPSFLLRTDPSELVLLSGTSLAADGDVYRVMIAAPAFMPDYFFYPIALTCAFNGPNTLFWQANALYTIVPPVGVVPLRSAWRSFTMDPVHAVFNGADLQAYQTAAPVFQGFPPSEVLAQETGISAIGGFQFRVATFVTAERDGQSMSIDARWLAFPRAVVRSAGFYTPRMYFKPN